MASFPSDKNKLSVDDLEDWEKDNDNDDDNEEKVKLLIGASRSI